MGSAAALFVIVGLAIGAVVGWQIRHARGAHGDMKTYKNRIPVLRKTRNRSYLIVAAVVILFLFLMRAMVR
ncbi:MAG TPA: hypothetical protein VG253_09980 [Streptosporangiaceae bacterium]|jgi:hypothetical protein|nr:hypothetical protein [Streptosporangiaceae bacterium]